MKTLLLFLLVFLPSVVNAGSILVSVNDQYGESVFDAVVYVQSINGQVPESLPQAAVIIDQRDEMYVPHVRATTIGSFIDFPNSDVVQHHVYSFSEAKTFELPLYLDAPVQPVLFDKAGLVVLGCNIHDHMRGYVLVLDTPYFAEVAEGSGLIENVAAGNLEIKLWHPRLGNEIELSQQVVLDENENLNLVFDVNLLPEQMVRRAPKRGKKRY